MDQDKQPARDQASDTHTQAKSARFLNTSLAGNSLRASGKSPFSFSNLLRILGFIILHQLVMALVFFLLAVWLSLPFIRTFVAEAGGVEFWEPSLLWEQVQKVMFSANTTALASIVTGVILIPILILYLRRRRRANPYAVMTRLPQGRDAAWSIWALLAAQGLSMLWLSLLDWLSQYSTFISSQLSYYAKLMGMIADEDVNLALALLATSVIVPILEELIYRGVVLGELRLFSSERSALIIQALIFGLIHANFIQSVYAFVLGLVIGYIYYKTESMLMSILTHMAFNFLGGGLPLILGEDSALFQWVFLLEIAALVSLVLYLLYLAVKPKDGLEDGDYTELGDREF